VAAAKASVAQRGAPAVLQRDQGPDAGAVQELVRVPVRPAARPVVRQLRGGLREPPDHHERHDGRRQTRAAQALVNANDPFLSTQASAADPTAGGLENVDFWIGGMAEKPNVFGGLLGPTFNVVFERQLEKLQDGDRFYYLQRTDVSTSRSSSRATRSPS